MTEGQRTILLSERAAHERLVRRVIAAFFDVYNGLGHGFLELVYARALEVELGLRGVRVDREVSIEAFYRNVSVGSFRADLVVEEVIVVESKATPRLRPADRAQLVNYLRAGRFASGVLLHFGSEPSFWRIELPVHRGAPRVK